MKYFILITVIAIGFFFMSYKTDNVLGGRCSGGANCYACKNCSGCKNCAKEGGSCSVCKDYSVPKQNIKPKPKSKVIEKKKSK